MKTKKQNITKNALWIAGLAGGATSANAALVQITLDGMGSVADGSLSIPADLASTLGATTIAGRNVSSGSTFSGSVTLVGDTSNGFSAASYSGTYFPASAPDSFGGVNGGSAGGQVSGGFDVTITINGIAHMAKLIGTAGGQAGTRGVTLQALIYNDDAAEAATVLAPSGDLVAAAPTIIGSAASGAEIQSIADINSVPEPSGLALLAIGAAGLVTRRQRKVAA